MCPFFLHYFYLTPVRIGIFFLAILAAVHFFFLICQNKDLIQFLLDRCHAARIFALDDIFDLLRKLQFLFLYDPVTLNHIYRNIMIDKTENIQIQWASR